MQTTPSSESTVPSGRRRQVLFAVTGLTPQVVTETLYALLQEGRGRLPDEVYVLTTSEGAERVRLALLSDQPGWFARFCKDYATPAITFDADHVHELLDRHGQPMPDIRTAQDNACAADQVAERVRALTQDPDTDLHVSLAGGRKTLGFFAAYALSLWGRPGDRLSHVLVDDPYESSWEFFYPTPYERIIETRDKKLADCRLARVTLADIPFVRMREGLPSALRDGRSGFAQAVAAAQGRLTPPTLCLDLEHRRIRCGATVFNMPPAELAFLSWFARRAVQGLPALPTPKLADEPAAQAYLAEYQRVVSIIDDRGHTARRLAAGMDKAFFDERKSKLKRALVLALGEASARPYCVDGRGRPKHYALGLPAQAIRYASLDLDQAGT